MSCFTFLKLFELFYDSLDRVEYTDCLGRTRKCLKKDLPSFQRRDQDLSRVVEARNQEQTEILLQQRREEVDERPATEDNSEEIEKILHIPQPDDIGERFTEQRQQWERQEVKNMQKEFVHYQDVLFDGKCKQFYLLSFMYFST